LTRAPAADRTDDEELSQDQTLLAQHSTNFDLHLLWDGASTKTPSRAWMDPFLFGEPSSRDSPHLHMDVELNYDDQSSLEDDTWSDPHDLSLDSGDDYDLCYSELNVDYDNPVPGPMDVDLQDNECVIPPAVFEFSDDDLSDPFQPNLQTTRPDTDRDEFAESENDYFLHDHVLSGNEKITQVMAELGTLGPVSHGGTLLQSPCSSSIAELVFYQEDDSSGYSRKSDTLALNQPQLTPSDFYEKSPSRSPSFPIYAPASYHSIDVDIDIELGILSDMDSHGSHSMETTFEEYLKEFDDEGGGDLVPACLVLLGKNHSHPATTLLVTCPSEGYLEEHQEDGHGEDREPGFEQDIESTLDGGASADRNAEALVRYLIEDWGEDALLVMDF
jgi:hypothetical protein